ncbi:AAA family ATPase [Aeromonas sp. A5]|uniref:AAA family ATPase n=1 Tax=unclassified Aeromonas TaxID=257493 RepID=UPI00376FA644
MKLIQLYVSDYKNLKEFTLDFSTESFLEMLVGKNGSGKSNFIEALLEVFRHIYQYDWGERKHSVYFSYRIRYEINEIVHTIEYDYVNEQLLINGRERARIGDAILPEYILTYYAGHNSVVTDHITSFERRFSERLIRADQEFRRPVIGIDKSYNELLLTVILLKPDISETKQYVLEKLSIEDVGDDLVVDISRPYYAKTAHYDVLSGDDNDETKYWRLAGVARTFLNDLDTQCRSNLVEGIRTEGYLAGQDIYRRYYSLNSIRDFFSERSSLDLFRMLDNIKMLGMLKSLSLTINLRNGTTISSKSFSDGQLQTIYLYSIAEIFKESNSITIMDEPDAFLHPEWRAECSSQIQNISVQAATTNHIIMTTHSAVTLINSPQVRIRFFEEHIGNVRTYTLPKKESVRRLCQGVITYSEQEQMLSILNAITIEEKPVLFTEGSTDPLIVKAAWDKLYPTLEMPFIPFYAFSCTYINQLITDLRIHQEMNGRKIFALFDFDEAYNQWNGLNGQIVSDDIFSGLIKKWDGGESYALMLPIPNNAEIKRQVIQDEVSNRHYEGRSYCMIEHIFFGIEETADYFSYEDVPGGQLIKFQGCKTTFAKSVVPTLPVEMFETFRPMLDWIKIKCE